MKISSHGQCGRWVDEEQPQEWVNRRIRIPRRLLSVESASNSAIARVSCSRANGWVALELPFKEGNGAAIIWPQGASLCHLTEKPCAVSVIALSMSWATELLDSTRPTRKFNLLRAVGVKADAGH